MSPETREFLVEFARAVQRFGIYPPGHPATVSMVEQVCDKLDPLLAGRDSLEIHIERTHLQIGDSETDPKLPLLSGLADRLYRHQLFNLTFRQGINGKELSEFMAVISAKAGLMSEAFGAGSEEELNRWSRIGIEPIPYSALSMQEESTEDEAGEESSTFAGGGDADAVAEAMTGEVSVVEASARLGEMSLPKLSELLKTADPADVSGLHDGISRLILGMEPRTLRQLCSNLPATYKESIEDCSVEQAITEIIEAADSGSQQGAIAAFLRLLTKLAMHADVSEESDEVESDDTLGELVQRLGSDWEVEDINPAEYEAALRQFSTTALLLSSELRWSEEPDEKRVVQISIEIDEAVSSTMNAADGMVVNGQLGGLMDLLETAPENSTATTELWQQVDRQDTVTTLLSCSPVSFGTLDRILTRVWMAAAEPMLDYLYTSQSRSERLDIIERLALLGPEVRPMVVERLDDEHWYVVRNMLVILGMLPGPSDGFSPWDYMEHPDHRVKREALKIALSLKSEREVAIMYALQDPDEQFIELGMEAAESGCPAEAVPQINSLLQNAKLPPKLQLSAIRALAVSRTPEALKILINRIWKSKLIFWRALAPKSADMLEALAALKKQWSADPIARAVLKAAEKSSDPQIRIIARKQEALI